MFPEHTELFMLGESSKKKLSKYSKFQVWRASGKSVVILSSPWKKLKGHSQGWFGQDLIDVLMK